MDTNSRNQTAIYVGGLLLTGVIIVAGVLFAGKVNPNPEATTVIMQR